MLTSTTVIDQITVTQNGIILYREVRSVFDDGTLISQQPHRSSLTPGSDLTGVPAQVAAMAQFVWTPEVIAAWQQQIGQSA